MMMKMRGGSTMFAKYCRKGQQYSSSSSNNNNNNTVRELKTSRELSEAFVGMVARRIPDAIESIVFKTGIFYFGYTAATYNSPYNPEKYVSEREELSAKRQELEKKKEALIAKKMQISNPV
ncbi:PREDICTED: uncharacterized protein LOC104721546 [Camelina sativa]|uniref:Uncharacterized protein LOC104721546 n=1 Tax=Camelina sativa TaxID=90675 RepID=A0ABM0U9D2_CAMSA|nr:PREDICTED: uncharacterized protein LOC104721546 [Camelina sativa]